MYAVETNRQYADPFQHIDKLDYVWQGHKGKSSEAQYYFFKLIPIILWFHISTVFIFISLSELRALAFEYYGNCED